MNTEIKKLWVDALRSGEYKQGKGRLKDEDKFCCLGVLCDLHAKTVECRTWDNNEYNGKEYLPPSEVLEWAQLDDRLPILKSTTLNGVSLSTMNDIRGYDFNQIAAIIEKSL